MPLQKKTKSNKSKLKEENVVKIGKTEDLPNDEKKKIEEQQKEIVDNLTDLFNSRNIAK